MRRPSLEDTREWARALLYIGVATTIATIFLFVCTVLFPPIFMGDDGRYAALRDSCGWIGLAMALFGLRWMVLIYRRDPEAGRPHWRLHEWD